MRKLCGTILAAATFLAVCGAFAALGDTVEEHEKRTDEIPQWLPAEPKADGAKMPDGMQWGVTFGFYATNGYFGSVEAKAEIDAIARAGATWVTVVPTVWQDACSSSFQYKDFALTPNDIELMDAIDLIHAKGMNVQLRPMLECKDGRLVLSRYAPVGVMI